MIASRRLASAVAGVLLAGSIAAVPTAPSASAADSFDIAFVSASELLPGGDAPIVDHLVASGHVVTVIDDNDLDPASAALADLVIVSTTVSPAKVGSSLADVAVPVISWERSLHDEFGLTANGGSAGQTVGRTKLDVVDPSHPIAGGLSGDVVVTSKSNPLSYGVPGAAAQIVATDTSNAARAVIFAYDTGDTLADGSTAAAPRVGFFMSYRSGLHWTADARTMFDNAVAWAADTTPPANTAPTVVAGDDRLIQPGTITLAGSVTDDALPVPLPTVTWTGPSGVTFADASDPATAATFDAVGSYTLTLTADDTEFVSSDTVTIEVTNEVPASPPEVLWVSNKSTVTSGEAPGVARLEAAGMIVTIIDDDVAIEADAIDKDLVVVGSAISPGRFDAWFADLPVPIFVWEAFVYDDLGFVTGSGQKGQASKFKKIDIEDSTHPAAGGLTGNPTVLTSALPMSWAKPAGDANIIATLDNSATRAVVFTYDEGAQMQAMAAPARRTGFFLTYSGPNRLTDDGWAMWDAAIEWTLNGYPPVFPPVAAATADPTSADAPATIVFDASASTDPDDDIVSYEWTFGDGLTESATTPIVSHTYVEPGTYTVDLTVTDSLGASDTAQLEVVIGEGDLPSGWAFADRRFRTRVTIDSGAVARVDRPAVSPIDFTALFAEIGAVDEIFAPDSIAVVEVAASGDVVTNPAPFQFDPSQFFDPATSADGELVLLLDGATPANTQRFFDVYFDSVAGAFTPSVVARQVEALSGLTDEGLAAIKFETAVGDWWFDEDGGGFTSLDDVDGNDWISWNASAGSAGRFRGIPNAVFPDGYFHPGDGMVTSSLVTNGPLRATVESVSDGGGYTTRWHVYPGYAEMTMVEASGNYWFLYEGTPGGQLDVGTDTVVRPDGTVITAAESFDGDLPNDEWAYFTDQATDRSLFVAHLEDDVIADKYKPLNDEMTVFAFGRGATTATLMSAAPQRFVVGLRDGTDFTSTAAAIESATEDVASSTGATESLIVFPLPPIVTATADVMQGNAPLLVSFDASTSFDPDGTIVSSDWQFGDGTGAATAQASHTYADDGYYLATFTATDDEGLTTTASIAISVGNDGADRITDGLVALYEFADGAGDIVADTSGQATPLDLTIADPASTTWLPGGGLSLDSSTTVASAGPATKVIDAAVATNELTIEAWLRTPDLTQNGPARIVSISNTTSRRNATLGQGVSGSTGDRIEARFRTSTTGLNGLTQTSTPAGSLGTELTHVVMTHEAGQNRIYIDGELATTDAVTGDFSNWDSSMALLLGSEPDGSRSWLGELHLVAIYDRSFSQADACANRSAGVAHFTGAAAIAPSACLAQAVSTIDALDTASFNAADSGDPDGFVTDFSWDFGDGTTAVSALPDVDHQFTTAGSYTVTVTVTDDSGFTSSASTELLVRPISVGRIEWNRITSPDPRLPRPVPTPSDAQQVASQTGDLDGDGDDDIVIVLRGGDGASIVWYEYIDATAGWALHTLEDDDVFAEAGGDIFDIDGDGDLDLAFGGGNSSGEIWWWENPAPAQAPSTIWPRHTLKSNDQYKHHDMRFGDFDGDGDPELAYWNQHPQQNGNRLFVAEIPADPTTLWASTEIFQGATVSEGLDVADIDLDGLDDIVGAGFWFKRAGNGTYTPNVIDPTTSFTRTVVAQLVPGGRPEVVIDSGDAIGPLTWFGWNENTSAWDAHELIPTSTYGHSTRVADFNDDGHLDVFSAEMVSPQNTTPLQNPSAATRIFFGDGMGNFDMDIVDSGFDHHESRVADLDGDGDIDIVGKPFNIGTPGINVWINEGVNPLDSWGRVGVDDARPGQALFIEHADIDGDGLDDVITGGWWYRNPGTQFGTWTRTEIGAPLLQMAAVGDLDGDGDIDIIGNSWQGGGGTDHADFHWAQNDGSGNFTVHAAVDTGQGPFLQGAALGVVATGGPQELVVSWNTGATETTAIIVPTDLATNPAQAPWATRVLSTHSEGEAVVLTDMDADGDTDLFLGTTWLRQDPGDTFTVIQTFAARSNDPDRLVFADMDGDGDDDVVIGFGHGDPAFADSNLSWFERPTDPEATWIEHPMSDIINIQSLDVADLDGDGDMDVVMGEHAKDDPASGRLLVFANNGSGTDFEVHSVFVGDEHHDGAQLVDLDGDGDLDVISIGFIQQQVTAYYNNAGF